MCSETGCASVKLKLQKTLDLENKSKITLWWGWGYCLNHKPNLHKYITGKGERSYKHELTSNLLIYQNRLHYHRQPCSIIPITKQTSFNYKAAWLLAPTEPQKSYYRHTFLWLGNNLLSAFLIVYFNMVLVFKVLFPFCCLIPTWS